MENKESNNKNTISIIGFILSFIIPVVGLILSIIGLKKSDELNEGRNLSITGILISIVLIIISSLFMINAMSVYNKNTNNNKYYNNEKNNDNKTNDDKKDNDKSTDKEDDNKTEKETYNVANKDELLKEGFKKLDLNKTEETYRKIDRDLIELDTNLEKMQEYETKESEKISFENGKFIYNNVKTQIYKEIDNVKEVKYNFSQCEGRRYIFIITNSNKIWYQSTPIFSYHESEFKELKGNYVDVSLLWTNNLPCGYSTWYLLKDTSGAYYKLNINSENNTFTEELYNNNTFYIDRLFYEGKDHLLQVMNDKSVYYNDKKSNINFKFGIYPSGIYYIKLLEYFVSEDNYLYNKKAEKYSDSKIKTILCKDREYNSTSIGEKTYKVAERYIVIYFEDGTYFDMKYYYTTEV